MVDKKLMDPLKHNNFLKLIFNDLSSLFFGKN